MPGPQKKPRGFKLIAGTSRPDKDEISPEMPQFPVVREFPGAPQHLNPDGLEMWTNLGRELVGCGVLQSVDLSALEQLC